MSLSSGISRISNSSLPSQTFPFENAQPEQRSETSTSSEKNESVFQIYVNCYSKTIALDVTSCDTIAAVKKQIQSKTGIPHHLQRLNSRLPLQNENTLAECQIEKGSKLYVDSEGLGGGHLPISGPNFANKKVVSASEYHEKGIHPGLNVSLQCSNDRCLERKSILLSKKFGVFGMHEILANNLHCPCCKESLSRIEVIFDECIYSIEAETYEQESRPSKNVPIEVETTETTEKDKLSVYNMPKIDYQYVKITTKPKIGINLQDFFPPSWTSIANNTLAFVAPRLTANLLTLIIFEATSRGIIEGGNWDIGEYSIRVIKQFQA